MVRLRVDRFALMTRLLGCESDAARAELIGVDVKTIRRARAGVIGERFIAQTIAGLRKHASQLAECGQAASLDELFEVVTAEEAA